MHSLQAKDDDVDSGGRSHVTEPVNFDAYLSPIANHAKSLSSKSDKIFLIVSGATYHCVREKALFSMFRPGKHVVMSQGSRW